jgi:hypothetical protein
VSARTAALALALALVLPGCAHELPLARRTAKATGTPADSLTLALYRMDETTGLVAADAGPAHVDGRMGPDTSPIFGRFGHARLFTASANSFVYVPYNPALESPHTFTIEAWIAPNAYSANEASMIAARWSPATDDHSWMLGIVGKKSSSGSPDLLWNFVRYGAIGTLMFVYQPEGAAAPRTYFSNTSIELQRWTHVAVTFDGELVAFWFDGEPQGTFAVAGDIRASQAPLLVGNYFDPRMLTEFSGELRQGPSADGSYAYAVDGGIDEVRLSKTARTDFTLHGGE